MTVLLWLLVFVGALELGRLRRRTAQLERQIADVAAELRDRRGVAADTREVPVAPVDTFVDPVPLARPEAQVATRGPIPVDADPVRPGVSAEPVSPWAAARNSEPPPAEAAAEAAPAFAMDRAGLEALIGGRLPIWIGGVALVLAGVFLVRFSIEQGLLGPGVRVLLAAGFALALLAAGEAARRLPATADDPRIAQVLTGAAVASAYGTLYMAAALYDLLGALSAFAILLVITLAALVLALRHGPPTAVMALVGGFAAPLVAGYDVAGIGPLIVYLALFTGALFALAAYRGWAWLAISAFIFAFGWSSALLAVVDGQPIGLIGALILFVAIGGSTALGTTSRDRPWLRAVPMIAGLVQFAVVAPGFDPGWLAWAYALTLSAAALFLAWRDASMLWGAVGALVIVLLMLARGIAVPESVATQVAAVLATLLFAVPGHLRARDHRGWALIAVLGTSAPYLIARVVGSGLMSDIAWALAAVPPLITGMWLAYRHRDRAGATDVALIGASLAAALIVIVATQALMPPLLATLPLLVALVGLALWAGHVDDDVLRRLALLPWLALLFIGAEPLLWFLWIPVASAAGDTLPYLLLPDTFDALRLVAPGAVAGLWLARRDPRLFGPLRPAVMAGDAVRLTFIAYLLLKLPLAIATTDRFIALGMVERVALTQLCLGIGWALSQRARRAWVGHAVFVLGIVRLVWLDLGVVSPLWVAQSVGALPVLNLAVVHLALAAGWCWRMPGLRGSRTGALLLALAAVLALVRQATHGAILTGPVGTLENWGYSAALLVFAILLLWRGIMTVDRGIRAWGLALITLVTLKLFLVDAASLEGLLRILSFLALGVALIAIGWAYTRFLGRSAAATDAGLGVQASP